MNKLSEKQLKSLERACDRANARNENGDAKLSLYIRVAESKIYNGKPVLKALLKEVIYLRMTDLHDNDTRIPNGTPWKDYEGWCYAKQEYLANRVGCEYKYASKALARIIKDGYLKTRKYRGANGKLHKQYFPDEAFIDSKIAKLGSADISDDTSDGETIVIKTSAYRDKDDRTIAIKTSDTRDNHDSLSSLKSEPIALITSKVCSEGVSEVCSLGVGAEVCIQVSPPSGSVDTNTVASLPKKKQNPNPYGALSTQAKTNPEQTKPCDGCGSLDPKHVEGWDCDGKASKAAQAVGAGFFDIEEA